MTTIVTTGGREYVDRDVVFAALDNLHEEEPITLLVHGACGWDGDEPSSCEPKNLRGADRLAHQWAVARHVPWKACPAHWRSRGRRAGPERNRFMLDHYKPSRVLGFPGGRGTESCLSEARARGITTEKAVPGRPVKR